MIITEIGGTVGDIESQPFLESARQVRHELGRDNVFFVHVSLVPYMAPPASRSRSRPSTPSPRCAPSASSPTRSCCAPTGRSTEANRKKIALMCDVDEEAVVNAVDAPSIYDIPAMLHDQGLDDYIVAGARPRARREVDWAAGTTVLQAVHQPKHEVTIGLVGKYIDLPDAYLSVTEALRAGGFAQHDQGLAALGAERRVRDAGGRRAQLGDLDGICVPGGFGVRGIEGKLGALRFARENGIPALGLCLGLQCMVIEYARNVTDLADASSSEFDPDTEFPVIATMAEQVAIIAGGDLGGTMRLGLYRPTSTRARSPPSCTARDEAVERHRHRYEVNNHYRERIADAGLVFSGTSPDGELVEFVELPRDVHPFYIGTQAHPELRSRPSARTRCSAG